MDYSPQRPSGVRKFPDLSGFAVSPSESNKRDVETVGQPSPASEPPLILTSVRPSSVFCGPQSFRSPVDRTCSKKIPTPDQSAFETDKLGYSHSSAGSQFTPGSSKMCPPTPLRTPAWMEPRGAHMGPPNRLVRRSSLNSTKILLELPRTNSTPTSSTSWVFQNQGTPAQHATFKFSEEYVNLGRIGTGTFSEVFCVRSRSDNHMYAVKKSKRQFHSKKDRAQFMQEVENFQRLGPSCEQIIEYYRAWQEEGFFFVQMELCERGNLENFLKALFAEGRLVPESTVWTWAAHITSALQHLHAANVIHFDVKPENIFLDKNGQLKLGDLGLARDYKTMPGDAMEGDSRYMAPELLSSAKPTPALDIFSLGIMLLQITSGCDLPDQGKLWRELRQGLVPSIRAPYSTDMQTLIVVAMTPNPAKRPTAWDILRHKHIEKALELLDDFVVTTPLKSTPETKHRSLSGSLSNSDWSTDGMSRASTPRTAGTAVSTPRTVGPGNGVLHLPCFGAGTPGRPRSPCFGAETPCGPRSKSPMDTCSAMEDSPHAVVVTNLNDLFAFGCDDI